MEKELRAVRGIGSCSARAGDLLILPENGNAVQWQSDMHSISCTQRFEDEAPRQLSVLERMAAFFSCDNC